MNGIGKRYIRPKRKPNKSKEFYVYKRLINRVLIDAVEAMFSEFWGVK